MRRSSTSSHGMDSETRPSVVHSLGPESRLATIYSANLPPPDMPRKKRMSRHDGECSRRDSGAQNDDPTTDLKEHSRFYLQGGDLSFRVENRLFKVHSYFFSSGSLFFRREIEDVEPEYRSSTIYYLSGVKTLDFERLLTVFYPKSYAKPDLSTIKEWISVLKLSTTWNFTTIRELAIRKLSRLAPPVDRILLSRAYRVFEWLIPAHIEMCARDMPPTKAEGSRLLREDLLAIFRARERVQFSRDCAPVTGRANMTAEAAVRAEVDVMTSSSSSYGGAHTDGDDDLMRRRYREEVSSVKSVSVARTAIRPVERQSIAAVEALVETRRAKKPTRASLNAGGGQ